jgi:hypothetical protein
VGARLERQERAMANEHERPNVEIGEGAEVYGSDGERCGRVVAVGAKYLTIVEGLLGQREYHIPVGLVVCGDSERVALTVPVAEAKARAVAAIPEDEPIYQASEPIPAAELESARVPTPAGDGSAR